MEKGLPSLVKIKYKYAIKRYSLAGLATAVGEALIRAGRGHFYDKIGLPHTRVYKMFVATRFTMILWYHQTTGRVWFYRKEIKYCRSTRLASHNLTMTYVTSLISAATKSQTSANGCFDAQIIINTLRLARARFNAWNRSSFSYFIRKSCTVQSYASLRHVVTFVVRQSELDFGVLGTKL